MSVIWQLKLSRRKCICNFLEDFSRNTIILSFSRRFYASTFTVWKLQKFTLTFFQQNSRESNVFTRVVPKALVSRNIFFVRVNFSFFHTVLFEFYLPFFLFFRSTTLGLMMGKHCTVWKNEKFTLNMENFREINSLVTSLAKALLSRNFCLKWVIVNFCNFNYLCIELSVSKTQCHSVEISKFLSFIFYVKAIFYSLEVQKLQFLAVLEALNFGFW